MQRTNCINCGGTIDADTAKCPFCGTHYVDLAPPEIQLGGKFAIRFTGFHGPEMMMAYVTDYKAFITSPEEFRDKNGRIAKRKPRRVIKFSIVAEGTG